MVIFVRSSVWRARRTVIFGTMGIQTTPWTSIFWVVVTILTFLGTVAEVDSIDNVDDKFVTCGSVIKLKHLQSDGDYYLYSENSRNAGASGQQIVTFSNQHKNSDRTLWWIHGRHGVECIPKTPITCGETIRLSHVSTKRNLHTHNQQSSLSRQQEITAWGDDYIGDGGDDWIVTCNTSKWKRSTKIRLQHVDTKRYLGAATTVMYTEQNCGAECPIMNHLEAFGRQAADEYGLFQVESGIFIKD